MGLDKISGAGNNAAYLPKLSKGASYTEQEYEAFKTGLFSSTAPKTESYDNESGITINRSVSDAASFKKDAEQLLHKNPNIFKSEINVPDGIVTEYFLDGSKQTRPLEESDLKGLSSLGLPLHHSEPDELSLRQAFVLRNEEKLGKLADAENVLLTEYDISKSGNKTIKYKDGTSKTSKMTKEEAAGYIEQLRREIAAEGGFKAYKSEYKGSN